MIKYKDPNVRAIYRKILRTDFASPIAGKETYNNLKAIFETGLVSKVDLSKIREYSTTLLQ